VCAEYVVGERSSSLEESRFSHEVDSWFCPANPIVEVMSLCIITCNIIFTVCILRLTSMILATPKQSLAKGLNAQRSMSTPIYWQSSLRNLNLFKFVFFSNVQLLMLLKKLPIQQGQPQFSHLLCKVNF
jgi:hypothetical protein